MRRSVYLCAGVLALAAVGYHWVVLSGRAAAAAKPTNLAIPLDQLPAQLNDWAGNDAALPENVVRVSAADAYLRRDYVDGEGNRVSLYIAYYGSVKDRVPHGPTVCYPYQGWQTQHDEMITLPSDTPEYPELEARKLLYEKNLSQVAVLYWYAANGKQQAAVEWQKFDSALRELIGQGGAYVFQIMVTAPVTVSRQRAFARLEGFLSQNFSAIAQHFPRDDQDPEER